MVIESNIDVVVVVVGKIVELDTCQFVEAIMMMFA